MVLHTCKHKPGTKPVNSNVKSAQSKRDSLSMQKDTSLQIFQTAVVDGDKYTAFRIFSRRQKVPDKFYIKNGQGQIVFTTNDIVFDVQFKDFDGDSYKDILLERRGVDSGQQDLLLYDPKTKKFILVGNCSNANRIKHTKYYYSYEDCCMGRSWSSDLFFIYNFKVIKMGFIHYDDADGLLKFYRINGEKEEKENLMEKWKVRINGDTPITTGRHIDFDLGKYWTKNYTRFIDK